MYKIVQISKNRTLRSITVIATLCAILSAAYATAAVAADKSNHQTTSSASGASNILVTKPNSPFLYFRFTPSTTVGATTVGETPFQPSQTLYSSSWALAPTLHSASINVTSRTGALLPIQAGVAAANTLAGSSLGATYGLNVGLDYRGFGVDAGYNRIGPATHASAQGADLSLSYVATHWRTVLSVGQHKAAADNLLALAAIDPAKNYSLEWGGAYQMTKALSLTGGLRYSVGQMLVPIFDTPDTTDIRKTAAVYFGTAIKF